VHLFVLYSMQMECLDEANFWIYPEHKDIYLYPLSRGSRLE